MNATATHHPTADNGDAIGLAITIASGLAIVGSAFNLSTTIMIRKTWNTLGRMVVALSLAIVVSSGMTILMQFLHASYLICQVFSFLNAFGFGSTLVWTCCFAHALFNSTDHIELRFLKKYWKRYLAISLIVPLLMGTGSVLTEFYTAGQDMDHCVQRPVPEGFDLGNLLVVVPYVSAVVFCIVCELAVIKTIKRSASKMSAELMYFPLIFAICSLPIVAKSLLLQFNGKVDLPSGVMLGFGILSSSQGIFNALAYGLSEKIRSGLQEVCCKRKRVVNKSLLKSVDYTNDNFSNDNLSVASDSKNSVFDSNCSIA